MSIDLKKKFALVSLLAICALASTSFANGEGVLKDPGQGVPQGLTYNSVFPTAPTLSQTGGNQWIYAPQFHYTLKGNGSTLGINNGVQVLEQRKTSLNAPIVNTGSREQQKIPGRGAGKQCDVPKSGVVEKVENIAKGKLMNHADLAKTKSETIIGKFSDPTVQTAMQWKFTDQCQRTRFFTVGVRYAEKDSGGERRHCVVLSKGEVIVSEVTDDKGAKRKKIAIKVDAPGKPDCSAKTATEKYAINPVDGQRLVAAREPVPQKEPLQVLPPEKKADPKVTVPGSQAESLAGAGKKDDAAAATSPEEKVEAEKVAEPEAESRTQTTEFPKTPEAKKATQ